MTYLKRRGFSFPLASEFFQYRRDYGRFPSDSICVTFDDGWKDTFINAFPILRDLGIPATVYVVTGLLGTTSDRVTADGEGPREHVSVDDVREMFAAGIEIGSHSSTHAVLDRVRPESLPDEIIGSRAKVADIIQHPCLTFAYPAGYYSAEVRSMVESAGYIGAFSTEHGPDHTSDIFAINRCEILRRHSRPFQYARRLRKYA